jgi:hypothetical protein
VWLLRLGITYLIAGVWIVFFTKATQEVARPIADLTTDTYPRWKVVTVRVVAYFFAITLWPIFAYGWFTVRHRTVWDELSENSIFQEQMALHDAIAQLCEVGVDADEMPGGTGPFGLSADNPIPCKTIFGSTSYLTRLRTLDGAKVSYERIGSVVSKLTPHPVDIYDISVADGTTLPALFISPYQKRISG